MFDLTKFKENLSDLIFDKNITQKQLAEFTGLDCASVCRYLKGNCIPNLKAIIALADFFDCSVDFLIGKTDEKQPAKFLPCPAFAERLIYYLNKYNFTAYELCKKVGLPDSRFYQWKAGTHFPSIETVEKFADFFDCSIDCFLGRES